MSCMIADYASGAALLEGLHAFLMKGHTLRPTFTGTGTGYCDDAIGTSTSVQETITATFTGTGTTFTVTGSVSGAMGTGTVGTQFVHARFVATLVAGATAWVAGDTVVWTMTAPWAALNYTSSQAYIYQAPGNDGTREVNVGWTVKSNSIGGYYGARIGAYPTWISPTFQWRPWTVCWWPLGTYSGSTCRLIVRVSGQFIYATCRIGTYYLSMCAGLYDAIGTWEQMPFPYAVGGCYSWASEPADSSTSWMYSATAMHSPVDSPMNSSMNNINHAGGSLYVRTVGNLWQEVSQAAGGAYNSYSPVGSFPRLPRGNLNNASLAPCLDDSIPTWSFVIVKDFIATPSQSGADVSLLNQQGVYGELPFVRIIPGYDKSGNLLVAESTFRSNKSRSKHIILQTSNVSTPDSLYAMEMV